jgi:hypothetical protein
MAFISISTSKTAAAFKLAVVLTIISLVLFPADLAAQRQPVQNGPMLPLAFWWGGACVLGLLMVYAILYNRNRTRSDKQVTDQATEDLYAKEERDRSEQVPFERPHWRRRARYMFSGGAHHRKITHTDKPISAAMPRGR